MNIYQRQHSETVFDRLWCCIFLLYWQKARDGLLLVLKVSYHPACVQKKKTRAENVSNDPSRPADARDKRHQWGLAESVSDNCSISRHVSQLVWKSGLRKMWVLKNASNQGRFMMNVIVWVCVGTIVFSLSMWNGCGVWLQQIIELDWGGFFIHLGLTSTPEECLFSLCASYHKTLEIQLQPAVYSSYLFLF